MTENGREIKRQVEVTRELKTLGGYFLTLDQIWNSKRLSTFKMLWSLFKSIWVFYPLFWTSLAVFTVGCLEYYYENSQSRNFEKMFEKIWDQSVLGTLVSSMSDKKEWSLKYHSVFLPGFQVQYKIQNTTSYKHLTFIEVMSFSRHRWRCV